MTHAISTFSTLLAAKPSGLRGWMFGQEGSTFARDQDDLFMFIFWLCVVSFVGLMATSVYFWIKYRRVPGVAPQRSPSHNIGLELTWTIIPSLFLLVIFVWGFRLYLDLHVAPARAEVVEVEGRQWSWAFKYDNGAGPNAVEMIAGVEVPVVAFPAGRPIQLKMHSVDVIHSAYVPDFRMKLDVQPFRYTTMWFEAPPLEEGETHREHYLFCAEYCGTSHSTMGARVLILPDDDSEPNPIAESRGGYRWWKREIANLFKEGETYVSVGALLYKTEGCVQCHTVNGDEGTGPTWKGVFASSESLEGGGSATVDDAYIIESILDPQAKIVAGFTGNPMVSYQGKLDDRKLKAIVAYIKSLSENPDQHLTEIETAPFDKDGYAPGEAPTEEPAGG